MLIKWLLQRNIRSFTVAGRFPEIEGSQQIHIGSSSTNQRCRKNSSKPSITALRRGKVDGGFDRLNYLVMWLLCLVYFSASYSGLALLTSASRFGRTFSTWLQSKPNSNQGFLSPFVLSLEKYQMVLQEKIMDNQKFMGDKRLAK